MKSILKISVLCLIISSFFFTTGIFAEETEGKITGKLETSNKEDSQYMMALESGTYIYFDTSRDISSSVGQNITINYTGTLESFTIKSITVGESGETLLGGGELPNTSILQALGILSGILFFSVVYILNTKNFKNFCSKKTDPKGYFEKKFLN